MQGEQRSVRMTPEKMNSPPTEVTPKPKRRSFTGAYKRRILKETEGCPSGQVGALLRREGLYSSHLSDWRRELAQQDEAALERKPRGPQADVAKRRIVQLEKDKAHLQARAEKAELLVEIQKKLSIWLGIPLNSGGKE